MKIVFICSSLEPGKDGVGDYLWLLATELRRQGNKIWMLALNDRFVTGPAVAEQTTPYGAIEIMRLPQVQAWPERIRQGLDWIGHFSPDWISLHFVGFGFHPKGLHWFLHRRLPRLTGGYRLHMMFHEMWVGWGPRATWKMRLWGLLQKHLYRKVLAAVRPRWVTTSNPCYAQLLSEVGWPADIQPVFGNIAVVSGDRWIGSALAGIGVEPAARKDWVLLGVFGSIHQGWADENAGWLDTIIQDAAGRGQRVALLGIGGAGKHGRGLFDGLRTQYGNRALVHHFGQQPEAHISEFLQACALGVATTPRALAGKSTTIASWGEHHRPVLYVRNDPRYDPAENARIFSRDLAELLAGRLPVEKRGTIQEVAGEFVQRLAALSA